jgi:hypothetical protein
MINGNVGASSYCNETGENCVTSTGIVNSVNRPDYQSPWTTISGNSTVTFTHNLGTLDTVVYLEVSPDAPGSANFGSTITHHGFGGDATQPGFYWTEKTASAIKVTSTLNTIYVRVTLWKFDPNGRQDTVTTNNVIQRVAIPVGAVLPFYLPSDSDGCPAATEGKGTWQPYVAAQGKFLLGTTTPSGVVGGSNTATLAFANLPAHTHTYDRLHGTLWEGEAADYAFEGGGTAAQYHQSFALKNTTYAGVTTPAPFSIIPPYIGLVYCIKTVI